MRKTDPIPYSGGYTLVLYCDQYREPWTHVPNHTFNSQTLRGCIRQAKCWGWTLYPDNTATCPICTAEAKILASQAVAHESP